MKMVFEEGRYNEEGKLEVPAELIEEGERELLENFLKRKVRFNLLNISLRINSHSIRGTICSDSSPRPGH